MKKMILAVLVASIALTGQAFAGNFADSCKDIHRDGTELHAKCKQAAQAVYGDESHIDLNKCIGNSNGALVWGGKNFNDHCKDKNLVLPPATDMSFPKKIYLKARCKDSKGNYVDAQIDVNERISNINSHLKYE